MKRLLIVLSVFAAVISPSLWAAFKLPEYQVFKLDNGLTVYLMPQSEVPMIDVQLTVRAGAVHDHQQSGLANLTLESLLFGSGQMNKQQIEDLFAFHGADFKTEASSETSSLSLSLAADDQQKLLPLFRDIALSPNFDNDEFSRYKKRFMSELQQQRESPSNVIESLFNKLYYGDHPYGNPVLGDENTINKLGIIDVKRFYRNFYTPDNSALVVVGDFQVPVMRARITQLFSAWRGKASDSALLPLVNVKQQPTVWLINKEDATETTFVIGGRGISANHPDAVAAKVINTIVGGRFTSWLNDELRVNSGLTYGVHSWFDQQSSAGSFIISTFTKNETTFEAIDLTLKTYQKLWEKGIDSETLNSAKAYVKGQFPPRFETSEQLAGWLGRMWALNLDQSIVDDFENQVDSLNVKKANDLAVQLFPENNLQFVLIGKSTDLRKVAKKYGNIKEMDIKTFNFESL